MNLSASPPVQPPLSLSVIDGVEKRSERWISEALDLSPEATRRLFDRGAVRRGGSILWPFARPRRGDVLEIHDLAHAGGLPEARELQLDVLYEDADILVLNKPRGLAVHPGLGHSSPTLVEGLLHRHPEVRRQQAVWPGLVHRLDRETSGVMVCALNEVSRQGLLQQFRDREIVKIYMAIARGVPEPARGTVTVPLRRAHGWRLKMEVVPEGLDCITEYELVEALEGCSLLSIRLRTGRTHQIRAHMSYIGHPLLGDVLYRGPALEQLSGQALHAHFLAFRHPRTDAPMQFSSPLPDVLTEVLEAVRRDPGIVVSGLLEPRPPRQNRREQREQAQRLHVEECIPIDVAHQVVLGLIDLAGWRRRHETKGALRGIQREIFVEGKNRAHEFFREHAGSNLYVELRDGTRRVGRVTDEEPYVLQVADGEQSQSVEKVRVKLVTPEVRRAKAYGETKDLLRPTVSRLAKAAAMGERLELLTSDGEILRAAVHWMDRYVVGVQSQDQPVLLLYRHALAGVRALAAIDAGP